MADSLDDFFAKKDKKRKNKNQSSVLSADTLVRELEEGSKQSEYSSRRDGKTSAAMELLGLDTNDNDWKDFEEVEKRDYSGLKVKEMSIQDQEEEHRRLNEKTEQVPEIKPWKSKEDTVAAILSAPREEVLPSELVEEGDEELGGANETTARSDDTKADSSKESRSKEALSSSSVAEDKGKDEQGSTEASDKPSNTTLGSSEVPKKDGDIKKKEAYKPPAARVADGVQELQPIKLSKLTGGSSASRPYMRGQERLNIQDEKAFPTLG